MKEVRIEHNPSEEKLKASGVFSWPVWTKEASEFPWTHGEEETCYYFLEGDVVVTPDGGEPVEVGNGNFVILPKGMSCTWNILKDVRKHYSSGTDSIKCNIDF